jgi:hypothetical protein
LERMGRCTKWRSATSATVPGTTGSLSGTGRFCGVGSGFGRAGSLSNALQRHAKPHFLTSFSRGTSHSATTHVSHIRYQSWGHQPQLLETQAL